MQEFRLRVWSLRLRPNCVERCGPSNYQHPGPKNVSIVYRSVVEYVINSLTIGDCTLKVSVSTIRENSAVHLGSCQLCSSELYLMVEQAGFVSQKDSTYEPNLGGAISNSSTPILGGCDVFDYSPIFQRTPGILATQHPKLSRIGPEVEWKCMLLHCGHGGHSNSQHDG